MTISRRDFLGGMGIIGLSQALFPSWMPRLTFRDLRSGAIPGDVLIVISLRGGMDGLTTVVPYGEGKHYYDSRPTIAVPEPGKSPASAIRLDDRFGLHPALRPLKEIFDAKQLAFVHAAGMTDPTRSHFDAMEMMERGTPGSKRTDSGWLNRHLQLTAQADGSPFRAIGMGDILPTSLSGTIPALALKSIADFHLNGSPEQAALMQRTLAGLYGANAPTDALGTQARGVFDAMETLSKLAATEYRPAHDARYPDSDYGMGLRQVAQLIKAGIGLEVACVDLGGWDTHKAQANEIVAPLTELGAGLYAFWRDMQDQLGNISLVVMSEFGRRVTENASHGTDHGHGNVMLLMGGGVQGGMYARWPGLAPQALDDGDLAITTDYREVLSELLGRRLLSRNVDQIFPNYTAKTSLNLFKARG